MISELDDAYPRARAAFLDFEGVVGVGYGPKLTGGKVVAWRAIVVLVERKLPMSKIPKGQVVPQTFAGVPTDVRTPRLTPETENAGTEIEPRRPENFCLTDYQWIEWPKIHRRWSETRKAPRRKSPKGGTL